MGFNSAFKGLRSLDLFQILIRPLLAFLMIESAYSKLLDLPFQSQFLPRLFALQLEFRNSLSLLITALLRSSLHFSMDIFFKCTLVQALSLCTGRTAHRGSRGIALLFHDHGTRSGWGVSVTPRPLFTPGKDSVPIVQEAEWTPGTVWTGAENLVPHRDSIPGPSST